MENSSGSQGSQDALWKAPCIGMFKVNVNGALNQNCNSGGVGVIVRDDRGHIVECVNAPVKASTVCMAEVLALRKSLQVVSDLNIQEVCIESDCKNLVDWFNGNCAGLLHEVISLSSFMQVVWMPRSANKAADWLAKVVFRGLCCSAWVNRPPTHFSEDCSL